MSIITGTIDSLEIDDNLVFMGVQARDKHVTFIGVPRTLFERLGQLFDGALEVDEGTKTKTLVREVLLGERIGFRTDEVDPTIFRIH